MRKDKIRKLSKADSERIKCQGGYAMDEPCQKQAEYCLVSHWNANKRKGVSFFYHCEEHIARHRK